MFGLIKQQEGVLWRSEEAVVLTGGQNSMEWIATGVAINVNEVREGDLFFAAHGDDLDLVFANGAAAAVVPFNMPVCENRPYLRVGNTFEALRCFAKAARFRTHASIIAVQGEVERERIAKALGEQMDVYQGGGHISQGLAALPDHARCGVFGFAPSVAPDIAVITDCMKAAYSRVFQNMPAHSLVIMDERAEGYIECLAEIKASGIHNIASVQEIVMNPKMIKSKAVRVMVEAIAATVMDSVSKIAPEKFAAFRVKSMIELGANKTVVLDRAHQMAQVHQADVDIPKRLDGASLVYTSRQFALESSLGRALRMAKHVTPHLRKITPEVLTPGDYMVFKKPAAEQTIEFSAALRLKKV